MTRFVLALVLLLLRSLAAQTPQNPGPPGVGGDTPSKALTAKPAGQETPASAPAARNPEMQVYRSGAGGGENERNENVPVTPVDFNLQKDRDTRIGPTATINQFQPDIGYFASEYGFPPSIGVHVPAREWRGVHGRLYESHSNSVFGARAFFQVGGLMPAHDNRYGFAAEAPLWRGSDFSLETNQQKTRGMVNGNVLVPLPSERTPLATDPALRDYVARLLASYPDQIPNRTDIDPRMLNTNSPQRVDGLAWTTRFDQRIGDRDRLTFHYRYIGQQVTAFQLVAGQNPDTTNTSDESRASWSRDWTPRTTTTATVGFDRLTVLIAPAKDALGPSFSTPGLQQLGPSPDVPSYRADNLFRQGAQLRHIHGAHTFVFGFEVSRHQYNGYRSDSSRPYFSFTADTHTAIDNLRLGLPNGMVISIGDMSAGFRSWDMSFYAGDTWRAAPNLTLSYGLRYQPSPAPYEVNHPHAIAYGCDCNNLAPQAGLAYRLPGAAGVFRMGYGLQYGPFLPSTYAWIRSNPPSNNVYMLQQPALLAALQEARQGSLTGASSGRPYLTILDPHMVLPYSNQYNASWERELRGPWRLQLGYVGSRTFKLIQTRSTNRALIVPGMTLTEGNVNDRRPDQRYTSQRYSGTARIPLSMPPWPLSSCCRGKVCAPTHRIGSVRPWTMEPTSTIREPWGWGSTASGNLKPTKT